MGVLKLKMQQCIDTYGQATSLSEAYDGRMTANTMQKFDQSHWFQNCFPGDAGIHFGSKDVQLDQFHWLQFFPGAAGISGSKDVKA